MKMFKFLVVLTVAFVLGLVGPMTAQAATTPSLGVASTFGLLANLFQDNATTTITGVSGNTLGVLGYSSIAGAGGVITVNNGSTENSTAAWTAAGIAQGVARTNLNNQYLNSCTDISSLTPAALEGVVINGGAPGTFPPGCYWSSGAMGITASGIVTLSGAGTHLFRPGGALTTGANSQVNLSGAGASACDVFWIPIAATSLGASSIFTGTDIDAAGITIGNNVEWSGQALAYGGTVTSNVALGPNTITVPTCTNPASLTVTKTVINDGGGSKVVADFPLFVSGTAVTSGWLNNFTAGAYVITETTDSNYTQTFSDNCPVGNISLASGSEHSCTITNTYAPPRSSGGVSMGYTRTNPTVVVNTATTIVATSTPVINIVKVPSRLTPFSFGGGNVTYTYTVTNPGSVALNNVTVTDDRCSPVSRISGDVNLNNLLDLSERWIYTCLTNVPVTTMNIATAKGTANGLTATNYAFAIVQVAVPSLPNTGFVPRGDNFFQKILRFIWWK